MAGSTDSNVLNPVPVDVSKVHDRLAEFCAVFDLSPEATFGLADYNRVRYLARDRLVQQHQ
jgi:hypothetical protein